MTERVVSLKKYYISRMILYAPTEPITIETSIQANLIYGIAFALLTIIWIKK